MSRECSTHSRLALLKYRRLVKKKLDELDGIVGCSNSNTISMTET